MFPYGLPNKFSLTVTMRLPGKSSRSRWDLVRIESSEGKTEFGIHVDGTKKEIRLIARDYEHKLQTAVFRSNFIKKVTERSMASKYVTEAMRNRMALSQSCP